MQPRKTLLTYTHFRTLGSKTANINVQKITKLTSLKLNVRTM